MSERERVKWRLYVREREREREVVSFGRKNDGGNFQIKTKESCSQPYKSSTKIITFQLAKHRND